MADDPGPFVSLAAYLNELGPAIDDLKARVTALERLAERPTTTDEEPT